MNRIKHNISYHCATNYLSSIKREEKYNRRSIYTNNIPYHFIQPNFLQSSQFHHKTSFHISTPNTRNDNEKKMRLFKSAFVLSISLLASIGTSNPVPPIPGERADKVNHAPEIKNPPSYEVPLSPFLPSCFLSVSRAFSSLLQRY